MRTLGAAGANGVNAPRGPGGRRDCAGNGVRLHAATPGVPRANTLGRSSAGRGRSDCIAAPAGGNARTRTGGRDGRPAAQFLGRAPEAHASALQCRATPPGGIHCDRIPLHRRGVGHGVRFQLPRQRPTPCPPTARARRTLYRTRRVALPAKVRGPSGRPPCRAACLTTSLAKNDQPRNTASPPLTRNGTSPPLGQNRRLAAE
jgi:hypothetical protein